MCPGSAKSGSIGTVGATGAGASAAHWRSRSACCRSSYAEESRARPDRSRRLRCQSACPDGGGCSSSFNSPLAIIVLSTAALLFRSADALARVNPGFVARGRERVRADAARFTVRDTGPPGRVPAAPARSGRRVPGGQAAGDVDTCRSAATLHQSTSRSSTRSSLTRRRSHARPLRAVSASYFDVLSIPAVEGRQFISSDEGADVSVAIVNEAFVRRSCRARTSSGAGSSAAR